MFVTLDFESYYDKDYSLKKLTTEEYIRDARFRVHGVGLKIGERPAAYFYGDNVERALNAVPWDRAYATVHNMRFDGAILSWVYGIRPKFLLDTLSMARAVFPHESGSLANLSKLCGLGEKGNELVNTMGVRHLSDEQQAALGEYCKNDVELTYALFQKLKPSFAVSELRIIDQTLRMFTEPVLELDSRVLEDHAEKLAQRRKMLLGDRDLTSLRSNPQFAKLLEDHGVEVPMKTSARTGKQTYAFAKTDEGMLALLEHENEEVQALAAARLGVKSSIEETRTAAFLGIASRGALPIPLNYFGAQNTGRFSGSDGCNMQNLPRGGALRKSITAPVGQVLVVSDFASIEARMLAWLAGQDDLLEQFQSGADIYCEFASRVYGRDITKEDKRERFCGKVCVLGLGYSLGWKKLASMMAVGPLGQEPILFSKSDLDAMGGYIMDMDCDGITTKLSGVPLQIHCSAAKHLVNSYREIYAKIPAYWKTCEKILNAMSSGVNHQFGCITTGQDFVLLPNGLKLQYKGLHKDDGWRYFGKRGEKQYMYSGKLAENLTQALARIVMTDAMLEVGERYKVVMTVHDEIVCCVPENEADEALAYMIDCMSVAPAWCEGLPLAAEGGISKSYGGAK